MGKKRSFQLISDTDVKAVELNYKNDWSQKTFLFLNIQSKIHFPMKIRVKSDSEVDQF